MKQIICGLVILVMFLQMNIIYCEDASVPYEWSNLPVGGQGFVTGIVMHPTEEDLIYIRTDVGGAYRWDKHNESWIQLCDSFGIEEAHLYGIDGIAIDPQNPNMVYIAAGGSASKTGDVLKSSDRGNTWIKTGLNKSFEGNGSMRGMGECIAVDPLNSNIIYCGTVKDGLWKSTDGAATWQQVTGISVLSDKSNQVRNIVFDKNSTNGEMTTTIYVGVTNKGVYKSSDGGNSWALLSGSPRTVKRMEVGQSGALYIASESGLFKYYNNQWTEISALEQRGKMHNGIAIDPTNENILMCIGYSANIMQLPIYRSTDGGNTWVNMMNTANFNSILPWYQSGNNFSSNTHDIKINPLNTKEVWISDWHGVYRTKDITANPNQIWTNPVRGIEEVVPRDAISPPIGKYRLITGIADVDGFPYEDITQYPKRILRKDRSSDLPWMMSTVQLDYCEEDPNIIFRVGVDWNVDGKAEFTTDNMETWTNITSIPYYVDNNGNQLKTDYNKPKYVPFGRVAVSAQKNPETGMPSVVAIPAYNIKDNQKLPAGRKTLPIVSLDMGKTWQEVKGLPEGVNIINDYWNTYLHLASDRVNGRKFYLYVHLNGRSHLYVSEDWGVHWTRRCELYGNPYDVVVHTAPGMEGDVWVSMGAAGIIRSQDSGKSYRALNNVQYCKTFGFGKAAPGRSNPTLYLYGTINGVTGMYRSIDMGASFVRINDDSHKLGATAMNIVGDSRTFGLVYVLTGGRGYYVGKPEGTVLEIKTESNYYISDFRKNIIPEGWSGNFIIDKNENITNVNVNSENLCFNAIYDWKIWHGPIDYSVRVRNYYGANDNRAILYFHYRDAENHYFLSIGGGSKNTIELGKMINGTQIIIGRYSNFPVNEHTIRIEYEDDGFIRVTASKGGTTTILINGVQDKTFTSGKIGVATLWTQATFGDIRVISPNFGRYEEDFSNATKAYMDWSNAKPVTFKEGKMNIEAVDYSAVSTIWDTVKLSKNYIYSVDMKMANNTATGQCGRILFNVIPHNSILNNYYILEFDGSTNGKVHLKQQYDNKETEALATSNYNVNSKDVRVVIRYEGEGYVTVDCIDKSTGIKSNLFDRINLNSLGVPVLEPGKVGLGSLNANVLFDNVQIEEKSLLIMNTEITHNGQQLTSLATQSDKDINVSIVLENNLSHSDVIGKCIVVLKDENNIVKEVSIKDFAVSKLFSTGIPPTAVSTNLCLPAGTTDQYKLEAHFWDGLTYMTPLLPKLELK